ncbi:homoserine kinase [Arthrobacter sunyaminii]|uniref:homoserine kinase n=1 Tax=Arthrobacter sunyaminii TaxID=2816859 RepID=UPI001A947810|nr:homoserine kinase [Arthrobacter sunyaminii]MBO0897722.1 homoserine kinase [Arthrobacter sunyaminii]
MHASDSAALPRAASVPAPGAVTGAVAAGQDVTVRVPATSANLGPGFDSLGLAVGLYDTVRVRTSGEPGTTVRIIGEGAGTLPTDDTHLVVRTIRETVESAGFSLPGLQLDAENVIPHGRGLGSSASAIVSGVLAGNALLPRDHRLDAAALLDLCSRLEGHPDNVAPALAGGLAISWEEEGIFRSVSAPVHGDIIPVAAVPATELSTESARGLLPAQVPHPAAAANSGRAALLIHALAAEPSLLPAGTVDFLHQDYRASAMEPSAALMRHLREHGIAAVISGAGPTVMALANGEDQAQRAEHLIARHLADAKTAHLWRVLRLSVDRDGARVEEHQRY